MYLSSTLIVRSPTPLSLDQTALSGSLPFPVADPKEVLTYMQVLTMECVTGVEVSATNLIHPVRMEAGAPVRSIDNSLVHSLVHRQSEQDIARDHLPARATASGDMANFSPAF
jgi:hypothetical protein